MSGFPSTLIVQSDGSLYELLTDYEDPDSFLQRVQHALNGEDHYAAVKARHDAHPDDLRLMFALAYKHFQMWQSGKSLELCEKIKADMNNFP